MKKANTKFISNHLIYSNKEKIERRKYKTILVIYVTNVEVIPKFKLKEYNEFLL